METVRTFTAIVYVGLKVHETGVIFDIDVATKVIQAFVDSVGLCVTVTPTTFIYTNGHEPGISVGLINYPRFPSERIDIRDKALTLAKLLRETLSQFKVSVVFPDETVMLP